MTHRRKASPPEPDLIPFAGKLVCTDRDRHPQVRITGVMEQPGDAAGMSLAMTRNWDLISDQRPEGFTFRLRCKRCRRDVRLREDKVKAAFDALRQLRGEGVPLVLDISRLPC